MQQESSESSAILSLLAWIEVNKKKLGIIAIASVAVILAIVVIVNYRNQAETRASEALSEIKLPLGASAEVPAGLVESLLAVARDHQGTKAAARALLLAGGYLYAEKKYAEAHQQFTRVIQDYSESEWIPQAMLGSAASLEAQGKTAEAVAEYDKLRKRFSNHAVTDEAKMALARLYEADKPEEAYKLYDELAKANPTSGLGAEAGLRKEELKDKRPELAKLDAPIVAPTPTPGTANLGTNRQVVIATNRPSHSTTGAAHSITLTNRPAAATNVIRLPSAGTAAQGSLQPASAPPSQSAPPKQ
ncbi:MAG TPA: tetratricopeptide repeat protein [Methylomirabilota bacterium]|nr:tetratricopeptide repeat protein [Methylomirabilota bacterium]